jgi:hypothetical protein
MAISDTQKIDYLFKKIGYGITKTDVQSAKSPSNESVASPLLIRGDLIWQQSQSIPSVIPVASSGVVGVYTGAPAIMDSTSATNRTWNTGLTDWVTPEFGSTYQVRVYLDLTGSGSPQVSGTQLFPNGSGAADSWFFDYQSGVLTFPDSNLPPYSFTSRSIFIVGARYTGFKGIGQFGSSDFGNVNVSGNTVGITNINGNLNLQANGAGYIVAGNMITGTISSAGISSSGNISGVTANFSANITGNLLGNVAGGSAQFSTISGTLQTAAQPSITSVGALTQLLVLGSVTAGNASISGAASATSFTGNMRTNNILGTNGNLLLVPNGPLTVISSTGALVIPTGSTFQQPTASPSGSIRYNTDLLSPEYYSGNQWLPLGPSQITNQTITPDGTSYTYTLDHNATSDGVLVSINGVLQRPGVSYLVSANQITFYSSGTPTAPLTSDIIDVRFVAAGVAIDENLSVVTSPSIPVNTDNQGTILDAFDTDIYSSAKYSVSVTSSTGEQQLSDIRVVHNGTAVVISTTNNIYTGVSLVASYGATLAGNVVQLRATGFSGVSAARVQKTYFAK